MRPVRLQLSNFTSFKDGVDIDFEGLDRFAVSGPTGAGKSSLLDGLTFALFADAPRVRSGSKTDLVSLGRKSFRVVFDFRVGDQLYRVTRTRRRKGAGGDLLEKEAAGRFVREAESAEAVTTAVERLLGLAYDHFIQVVFLPQGRFAEFLHAQPGNRRRLLNELLRLLVFDRMRERAGAEQARHADEIRRTEQRLNEDFQGVSEEARAELQRRLTEQEQAVAETMVQLPALQERRDRLRLDRQRTIDLEGRRRAWDALEVRRAEIDAARREVEAAGRAGAVVPLLEQADAARQEDALRQAERVRANEALSSCDAEYEAARSTLTRAQSEAGVLPDLRDKANRLNEAVGRVPQREETARRLDDQRRHGRELEATRAERAEELAALTSAIASLEGEVARAEAEVLGFGYDERCHRGLEAARDPAMRLQGERQTLAAAWARAERDQATAESLKKAAAIADAAEGAARQDQGTARRRTAEIESALRAAEDAHRAAHLRAGLRLGEPCPVCRGPVAHLPADEPTPELAELGDRLQAARAEQANADRAAAASAAAAAAARARADAAGGTAGRSRDEANRLEESVAGRERCLEESVAGLPDGADGEHLEDRVLDAVRQAGMQEELHRRASDRLTRLQNSLLLTRTNREGAERETGRLDREIQNTAAEIRKTEEALERLRQEIRGVADADDPAPERDRVRAEIQRLEQLLAEAARAEREADRLLGLARARGENCAGEAARSATLAAAAAWAAAAALGRSGFSDGAAARTAFRLPERVQGLRALITDFEAEAFAVYSRIRELEEELQGRHVTEDEFRVAEQAHDECQRRRREAGEQAALLARQLEEMTRRLERAGRLWAELAEQGRQHRLYQQLAQDLRIDRFQAFLLEETLTALVRDASAHLARLTGDRYGLDFTDDRIVVVDHDNAGEARSVDTFSGGETFLASLALALALSEQVQRAVGAVHLDCLFIDEGFGTLDPETLRTVSDAIRGLQVGGRMVGVVTHIPQLVEEFDQRVVVEKGDGASCVRIEGA
jgi:exonuclease SbcC